MTVFASALFADQEGAARAIDELTDASFAAREISVLYWDREGPEQAEITETTRSRAGAVAGGSLGAALGAVGGMMVATGVGAPAGVIVAAGPVVAVLKGALGGAFTGGITGLVGGLAFWREEIQLPEGALHEGAILVGIEVAEERLDVALSALRKAGGQPLSP